MTSRSTWNPLLTRTDVFVSPDPTTSSTSSAKRKCWITGLGSVDDARISRSPIVSWPRRRLPAYCTSSTLGWSAICATRRSAIGNTSPIGRRAMRCRNRPNSRRSFSCRFGPMALMLASRFSRPAASSSSRVQRSWSLYRVATVLGPRPGMSSISKTPAGISLCISSYSSTRPWVANSRSTPAIPFPMPGMVSISSDSMSSLISTVSVSMRRAAFLNARTRNVFAPRISRASANPSRSSEAGLFSNDLLSYIGSHH